MNRVILFIFIALMDVSYSKACTNLIVGKAASVDGSVFISYSADDYGQYGFLCHYPAGKHAKGTKRSIYNWESNKYTGEIEEAPETYNVIGNINEFQVSIGETTFGGRPELADSTGIIDYGSLIYLSLQRSKTARQAIDVMTSLVKQYGYNSEGESFTIADPNEAWIMEMIGKGVGNKGAVWVAVRVPDDCICAHANQSRIHRFNLKDKKNCIYSPDVISFARKMGYFSGKDSDFDFANAYCPAGFSERRFCEARVWSFFNKWTDGMEQYLEYVEGKEMGREPMPLFVKPTKKLSVQDVFSGMRDHYEGTPFDLTKDAGAGPYDSPYRPTPLTWTYNGKTYFNERPISTQQTAFVFVSQLRSFMPDAVGGVLWFGADDANMVAFTPIYCCTNEVPECYSNKTADAVTFSWKSAFWSCNFVANMVYPRYSMLFGDVEKVRNGLENSYIKQQTEIEKKAMDLLQKNQNKGKKYLQEYSVKTAQEMLIRWNKLGEHLIVKYNDQTIRPEKDGHLQRSPYGLGAAPIRVGYPDKYRKVIIEETDDRYLVPKKE